MNKKGAPSWIAKKKVMHKQSIPEEDKDNLADNSMDIKSHKEEKSKVFPKITINPPINYDNNIEKMKELYEDDGQTVADRLRKACSHAHEGVPTSSIYLEEMLKVSKEQLERYKYNMHYTGSLYKIPDLNGLRDDGFVNKEKIYAINNTFLKPEEKLEYNKLKKSRSNLEKQQQFEIFHKTVKMVQKHKQKLKKKQHMIENNPDLLEKGATLSDLESDFDDETTGFEGLSSSEMQERVKWLWFLLILKANGASSILNTFNSLNHQILELGTKRGLIIRKEDEFKPYWFIIDTNSTFKKIWNIVVILLLIYTATYAPYRMAFVESVGPMMYVFETLIDSLFIMDFLVNLIAAYENEDGTVEKSWKKILINYLKGWFFLDLVASFPFQVFEVFGMNSGGGKYNTLRKLARLPRLMRIFRVLRIVKLIKVIKNNKGLQQLLDKISMNPGIMRLITTLVIISVCVHVYSCLWFLQAKMLGFFPDSWVYRRDVVEETPQIQYLHALYWTFQILSTVGFGDFGVGNEVEIYMSNFWMMFGVAFYSFVLGNIQSIVTKMDEDTEDLVLKLKALEVFKKKFKLKETVYMRIKRFLEKNYNDLKWTMEFDTFLPASLNDEIMTHIYGDTVNNIHLFTEIEKKGFVWEMLPHLTTIKVEYNEIVYLTRDLAREVYFIKLGGVRLFYKGQKIASVEEGDYFGDVEVLFNINREFKAKAKHDCTFLVIMKKQFLSVLENYPDIKHEIYNTAREKREKWYDLIIHRNLPMPEQTLDVYGLNDLKATSSDRIQKGTDKSLKAQESPTKKRKTLTKKKLETEVEPIEHSPELPQKPRLEIQEPMHIDTDNINPLESVEIKNMEKVMDAKLQHNEELAQFGGDVEVLEEDVAKILENYKEDMDLVYLGKSLVFH